MLAALLSFSACILQIRSKGSHRSPFDMAWRLLYTAIGFMSMVHVSIFGVLHFYQDIDHQVWISILTPIEAVSYIVVWSGPAVLLYIEAKAREKHVS